MTGVFLSVAAAPPPFNEGAAASPWLARLAAADLAIWWTGLATVAVAALVWLVRGRRDPLAKAPARPNRLLPEHVILLMVAFLITAMLLQGIAELVATDGKLILTAGNATQLLGGMACLAMGAGLFPGGLRRFLLGPTAPAKGLLRLAEGVVLTLAVLSVCNMVYGATEWLIRLGVPDYVPPEHSVIDALRARSEPLWSLWLGAALVAPVAEELFFRGLAQTVLRNLTRRPWFAVLTTSVAFGLAHAQQPQVIPTIALLGIILGVSYERTGSLVAPITVHVLFNTKTLVWEACAAAG